MKRSIEIYAFAVCALALAANGLSVQSASAAALTESRSVNVRVNPLGLMVGYLNADVDIRVSPRITLGPSGGFFRTSGSIDWTAYLIGPRANFFLLGDAFQDGAVLGAFGGYWASHSKVFSGTPSHENGFFAGSLLGYQWYFSNGINIGIGGGVIYFTGNANSSIFSNWRGTGEFTLGIAL
jgi:hypothetical protein